MRFFKNVLVHVTLAASVVVAVDDITITDDTKTAKSLRGAKKVTNKRRGLKGTKEGEAEAWHPDPWDPNPWKPT